MKIEKWIFNFFNSLMASISHFFLYKIYLRSKGVNVTRYVDEAIQKQSMPLSYRLRMQQEKLKFVSSNAYSKSTLYKQKNHNRIGEPTLKILTKKELSQASAESLRASPERYILKRTTSGTSGLATTVFLDSGAFSAQLSIRKVIYQEYGINVGDTEIRLWGRGVNSGSLQSKIKNLILNRKVFDLSGGEEEFLQCFNYINQCEGKYIYGYSSLVFELASWVSKKGLSFSNIKAVICTAENLSEKQRLFINKIFCCPVYVEYGCSETDIIASTCRFGILHVHMERVLIEQYVNDHETKDVLITDLDNIAYPIIRYALGDSLSVDYYACRCGKESQIITEIFGRSQNQHLLFQDGNKIHAVEIAYIFSEIFNDGWPLFQWRVTQTNYHNLLVEIIDIDDICESKNKLNELLRKRFHARFAGEFVLNIIYVNQLSRVKGKLSYFISMSAEQTELQ